MLNSIVALPNGFDAVKKQGSAIFRVCSVDLNHAVCIRYPLLSVGCVLQSVNGINISGWKNAEFARYLNNNRVENIVFETVINFN